MGSNQGACRLVPVVPHTDPVRLEMCAALRALREKGPDFFERRFRELREAVLETDDREEKFERASALCKDAGTLGQGLALLESLGRDEEHPVACVLLWIHWEHLGDAGLARDWRMLSQPLATYIEDRAQDFERWGKTADPVLLGSLAWCRLQGVDGLKNTFRVADRDRDFKQLMDMFPLLAAKS